MPRGEANESQKFWWSGPVVVKREGGAEARQCMICMYTVPALEVAGCCRLLQLATHWVRWRWATPVRREQQDGNEHGQGGWVTTGGGCDWTGNHVSTGSVTTGVAGYMHPMGAGSGPRVGSTVREEENGKVERCERRTDG